MKEHITLGSTPCEEDCAQVGEEGYSANALLECDRYMTLISKVHGDEPKGAKLGVKSFAHDFGKYYEVVCYYDTDVPESIDYAFTVENDLPATWEG